MEKLWSIVKYSSHCCIWVLLMLALIQPFGIDNMKEGRLLFILAETLLCFISICISEGIVTCVSGRLKEECPNRRSFAWHIALSNAINIPLLGAFLLTYNSWCDTGNVSTYWFWGGHFTLNPLFQMSSYVAFLSVFLVVGQYLNFRNSTLQRELNEIKAINRMLEQRQEQLEQIEEEPAETTDETVQNVITIVGQGQDASLTLDSKKVIYVESMANYADICYIDNNEICHKTLRITLKQMRENLEGVDSIVQCHRAFLVNINFVVAMEATKSAYQLQLFGMDKQIPVSRANVATIKTELA